MQDHEQWELVGLEDGEGRTVPVYRSPEQGLADELADTFGPGARLLLRRRVRAGGTCCRCSHEVKPRDLYVVVEEVAQPEDEWVIGSPDGWGFHPDCWEEVRPLVPADLIAAWLRHQREWKEARAGRKIARARHRQQAKEPGAQRHVRIPGRG